MWRNIKIWSITGAAGMGAVAFALAIYASFLQITGNFHSVIPGELYRSAQPTPQKISKYHHQYNIKTVINLRGTNQEAQWYIDEIAEAKKLRISHIDFCMSAGSELTVGGILGTGY